LEVISIIRGCH